ncbi:hypothetical protein [Kamptonema formosum]|uniref:hypothetical protein n=1 Tax=Kamptonema formosum TaxID=331992 RepID=UPI0008FBF3E1|nr:hypothetical protein [Oscillatoria sp. PCC 10802]
MKKLPILFTISLAILSWETTPASASKIDPTPVDCWFLRNGELKLTQTCTFSGHSWSGGGFSVLTWEDGVKTVIAFGLQGRGERPCPEVGVDGVCGEWRYRHPITFEPLSDSELNIRRRNALDVIQCVDVNHNSVCWHY